MASSSASSAGATIPSLKQSFVAAQTTLLSQPLNASRSWRASNENSGEFLPDRVVDDALFSLNHQLQQHCRRVYAPQATRNIAEQISDAYSRDTDLKAGGNAVSVEGDISKEADLTDGDVLDTLSTTWPLKKEATGFPEEAKRYSKAVQEITALNEQRKALIASVERLRQVKETVALLQTKDDSGAGIQENLATRDGPVEKELERMRLLLARVSGRVGQLSTPTNASELPPQSEATLDIQSLGNARKRTVDEFLNDPRVFPS